MTSVLTMDGLVTASQKLRKYVLTWGDEGDVNGLVEAETIVVMKRSGGFLLALPLDVLLEEVLDEGRASHGQGLVGPSTVLSLPGMMEDPQGGVSPIGVSVGVQVVDFQEAILERMRLPKVGEEFIIKFSEEDLDTFPHLPDLVSESMSWLESQTAVARVASYTPEVTAESGGEQEPTGAPVLPRRSKAKAKPAVQPGQDGALRTEKPEKQKRTTTAGLAIAVETLSSTLEALLERQQAMEQRLKDPPNPTTAALRRPLAAQVGQQEVALAGLAREFQSPVVRSSSSMIPLPVSQTQAPPELLELEKEKPQSGGATLADAMLAQSAALTTLVAQLSSHQSDPMGELTGGFGMGVKGAQGRARLQAELASNRGLFFDSVMRSMSRRMAPTLPTNLPIR